HSRSARPSRLRVRGLLRGARSGRERVGGCRAARGAVAARPAASRQVSPEPVGQLRRSSLQAVLSAARACERPKARQRLLRGFFAAARAGALRARAVAFLPFAFGRGAALRRGGCSTEETSSPLRSARLL